MIIISLLQEGVEGGEEGLGHLLETVQKRLFALFYRLETPLQEVQLDVQVFAFLGLALLFLEDRSEEGTLCKFAAACVF